MKKLLSILLLSIFIISCSETDPIDDENTSETVDPNGDDNSDGNSDNGGDGLNGNVFSFGETDVKSQWTFDGNQSSQGLQIIKSRLEDIQINQALIDSEDSLDVGILSIESPKTGELTSSETVSVIVGNYGYLSILDSLEISLQVKFEDGEFSDPMVETMIINDSLPPVEAVEYTFTNTLDLSERGTYYIGATTQLQDDMDIDNNTHIQVVKSLEYADVCTIHSLIFNEDDTFKLYTNNEEGVCNYVILGEYQLEQDSSMLKLYSPDSSQETNLMGNIYDVETDDDGGFAGTMDIEGICVQLEDGYEEENYTEGLTYIPDENLENYLIEIGRDDMIDGYITNSQASSINQVTIEAIDNWYVGSSIGFWDFDERFSNRISNLAGIEAFPNLEGINLMGQNLDSINISKNSKLKIFGANFNTFKKLDTSNNPELEWLSIDSNEVTPILDFSNNPKITMLSTPMCSIEGFIGEGGHYDISNMSELIFLDLYDNRLTSVDISKNTKLEEIRINMGNSISTIDFSNNILLETVLANNSGLDGELDVSNLTELEVLNVAYNNISSINLLNNTKLKYLEINGNQIEGEIDVSNCTNLLEFYANYGNNFSCIIVNQEQLDAYNGVNPPDGFKWELSIEPTLVGGLGVALGGNGNGSAENQLLQPESLVFDLDGNLYVADSRNSRVVRKTRNGEASIFINNIPGNVNAITYKNEMLYILSGSDIYKYNLVGELQDSVYVPSGNDGIGISINQSDEIYTVHRYDTKIYKSNFENKTSETLFEDNQYHFPTGIAIDSNGNVYVSNKNHQIRKWDKLTQEKSDFGFDGALSLTIGPQGNLIAGIQSGSLAGRNARIIKIDLEGKLVETLFDQTKFDSLDYHIGVLGIGFNKMNELYFSIGRDAMQDGTDFSDENVLKDRVFRYTNNCAGTW